MADRRTSRGPAAAVEDEEEEKQVAAVTPTTASDDDDDDDDEDDEEEPTTAKKGSRAAAADDDDDDDDYDDDADDDDDSIVIEAEWEEAAAPKAGEFPRVDKGIYTIALDSVEVRRAGEKAKHPGSKYAVCVFKIRPEDNEDKMEENAGTVTIWHSLYFSAKALGRTKETASAMGLVLQVGDDIIEELTDLAEEETLFEAVIGIEKYRATDENTGKDVNRLRNKLLKIKGVAA